MSHSELFSQGNEAYVDEDYHLALQKYSAAIELDGSHSEYFVKRATTYIRLGLYNEACADSNKAIELNTQNIKAHQRKGESLYHLGEYNEAKTAFEKGLFINETNQEIQDWIRKCKEKLQLNMDSNTMENETEQNKKELSEAENAVAEHKVDDETSKTAVNTDDASLEEPKQPLVKWDWYQNDKFVTISLMIKHCKASNVNIAYQESHVGGSVDIPSGGTYNLDIDLSHPVDITQCKTRILQTKIELKLKKRDDIQWTVLERDKANADVKAIPSDPRSFKAGNDSNAVAVHEYPSSRHVVKDWDRLASDITKDDDDKEEGEAALNALFQKIYGEGGDQVKKAMNKSFVESGGTVLSTNWDEVSKSKVERKPPDGMEWKNWEQ